MEFLDPVFHFGDHGLAKLGVIKVEICNIRPVIVRRQNFAACIPGIPFGVGLSPGVVKGGVIGHPIQDDAEATPVAFPDQDTEILFVPKFRIDFSVILDRIGGSKGAFAVHLPDRVDGHQPKRVKSQALNMVQPTVKTLDASFVAEVS